MRKIIIFLLLALTFTLNIQAQSFEDVIHTKGGRVLRGIIIEQTPNEKFKLLTTEGTIYIIRYDQVAHMAKEPLESKKARKQRTSRQDYRALKSRAPFIKAGSDRNNLSLNAPRPHYNEDAYGTPHQGYKGMIEVGYAVGFGNNKLNRWKVSTTHGYQFNPYVFLGAGVGYNCYPLGAASHVLPVFAALSITPLNRSVTPFIDVKIGYSFIHAEGIYINPTLGCRVGLGDSGIGLRLGVGFELQQDKFDQNIESVHGVDFKLGFDF